MGLYRAGFEVTGVDINFQPEYPFHFIQEDVFELDLEFLKRFDFIWASPPCQAYTWASARYRNRGKEYPDLIDRTRQLLMKTGRPFVIENVCTAPIRKDLLLCGRMFNLRVIKHRCFEIHGFSVPQPDHPRCRGLVKKGVCFTVAGHGGDSKSYRLVDWQKAMGIDWITDRKMLAEAIPPAYSEYIGRFAIQFLLTTEFLKR